MDPSVFLEQANSSCLLTTSKMCCRSLLRLGVGLKCDSAVIDVTKVLVDVIVDALADASDSRHSEEQKAKSKDNEDVAAAAKEVDLELMEILTAVFLSSRVNDCHKAWAAKTLVSFCQV